MWPCERLDAIDSTQRELQRRLAALEHRPDASREPFAVWTTRQTDGIASHGRRWKDASQGLAFSVAWPESRSGGRQAAWPIRLSLVVASALESFCPQLAHRLGVKWPNDIMCGDAKLAGVLVSRHAASNGAWLIAGIGINLGWDDAPDLDRPVTSLASLGVLQINAHELAAVLARAISSLWTQASDDADWRQAFERRDVHYRRRVSVVHPTSGEVLHEGIAEGISDGGELMLRIGEKLLAVQIGEVSLRPQVGGATDGIHSKACL